MRQGGFFGPEDAGDTSLKIIGVGATGSVMGDIAARCGVHFFEVWDSDEVESHNPPNSIYHNSQIGMKKVDAFEQCLQQFNPNISIKKHDHFFETEKHKDLLEGPVVLTVDTMSARKDILKAFQMNWKVDKVFETRLGFDYAEANVIDNMDNQALKSWEATLKNDEEIPEGPCNLRICTTLVNVVAGFTVHQICDMLSASRRDKEWQMPKKTIFEMKDGALKTFQV